MRNTSLGTPKGGIVFQGFPDSEHPAIGTQHLYAERQRILARGFIGSKNETQCVLIGGIRLRPKAGAAASPHTNVRIKSSVGEQTMHWIGRRSS